jgi:hypothetical protein
MSPVLQTGPVAYPVDNALFQWEDGWRALQALTDQPSRRRAEAVVDAIRDELRLRIGATFSVADLAELYGRGTDWCLAIAHEVAPGVDGRAFADAAFWQHCRAATDFAGGHRAGAAPGGTSS